MHHYTSLLLAVNIPLTTMQTKAWQSQENQILNTKSEILNNVKEQSAISSQ